MTKNKPIVCLAVDDEPPALEIIRKYISMVENLELAGCCTDALEAMKFMRRQKVDLLFLDIQMPQLLGTDLIRSLQNPPKIIFTTAFRKFAVEGFELNAVDYLLKPIPFERFLKAVNKVMDTNLSESVELLTTEIIPTASHISLRVDRRNIQVSLEEILYIESRKDYIKIVTKNKTVLVKQAISSIENMLPRTGFVRIHRSFIVAVNKIDFHSNDFIGIATCKLPVSRMYRNEVGRLLR